MQTYTIGKAFYPGAEVPLKVLMNLKEMPEILPYTAFQIIIIEEGTGEHFHINRTTINELVNLS